MTYLHANGYYNWSMSPVAKRWLESCGCLEFRFRAWIAWDSPSLPTWGFVPIREGLCWLSSFILFQPAFTKSHRLQKSVRHALLYHILSYNVCTLFIHCKRQREIEVYGKYKHIYHSLYKAIYVLYLCLTMFLIRFTLLSINNCKGCYH